MTDTDVTLKPLTADDLEAVIDIDQAGGGSSRRGYFEKRLTAATDRPKDFVYVGLHKDGALAGFAFAQLVDGAFGQPGTSASLDAIGVDPAHNHKGYGTRLLTEVEEILRDKEVDLLNSQILWGNRDVMGFFADAGFDLDSRVVLTRGTETIAAQLEDDDENELEIDYSSPDGDASNALSHDRIPVRSLVASDLGAITRIDRESVGADRGEYIQRKMDESLNQSGIRVSLVAEQDGYPVGFIMARVDFGEFGQTSAEAVMDTIGVDPGYRGIGVGQRLMAQLVNNLNALQVDDIRTEVAWDDTGLAGYLSAAGFDAAQRITLRKPL